MTGPVQTDPAAASLAVRGLLDGPRRDLEVVASFPQAVYLTVADDLLAVVTADGVLLPNALVMNAAVHTRPLAGVHRGQRGHVGGGVLDLGPLHLRVSRWWDPRPRLRPVRAAALRAVATEVAACTVARRGHPPTGFVEPLAAVKQALTDRDPDSAVAAAQRLVGLGPGLTPAGDDVLCGLFAGVHLLVPAVLAGAGPRGDDVSDPASDTATVVAEVSAAVADLARDRTTLVSAALLRHAARAEVAQPAAVLLRALTGHGDPATATDGLLAVGSTSGRDLMFGLLAAVDVVATVTRAHAPAGRTV